MRQIFERAGIKALLSQHPAIFSISFGVDKVTNARDWANSDHQFYRHFVEELSQRNIMVDEDPREPWCLCYSHTLADIDETLNTIEDAIRVLKK